MAEEDVSVHWKCYCYTAERSLYLDGRDPWADQEEILRFVAHKAYNVGYDYSAICDMLCAIRDEHRLAGLPNPLRDKPLVRRAMQEISEMQPEAPAWRRASGAAAVEARPIEHAAAGKVESRSEAARPGAAAEIIAGPGGTPSELKY